MFCENIELNDFTQLLLGIEQHVWLLAHINFFCRNIVHPKIIVIPLSFQLCISWFGCELVTYLHSYQKIKCSLH